MLKVQAFVNDVKWEKLGSARKHEMEELTVRGSLEINIDIWIHVRANLAADAVSGWEDVNLGSCKS